MPFLLFIMTFPQIQDLLFKRVSNAPLVVLRIAFGGLVFFSTIRFIQKGWVQELYVNPTYHFGFFEHITHLNEIGMYAVFGVLLLCALLILIGCFYRVCTVVFFILFTYTELIDKTFYLNHYYLVSILSFWMAMVPANRSHSIDALLFPKIRTRECSNWCILIFKVQLSIVYFYAGLAKVNPDWLLRAQPMATWLPGKYALPILGPIMHFKLTAFIFSWAGCLYDLAIWIFLWVRKTRNFAYFFVLVFHILTGILFPRIGMFPYIMITCTIIFFSASWHQRILDFLSGIWTLKKPNSMEGTTPPKRSKLITYGLIFYVLLQACLPLRYLRYDGNLFWHEQGYRFSWRVMLMEKAGMTSIIVRDPESKRQKEVDLDDYLTAFQKQQMRTQPDMILQFADHVGDMFLEKNGYAPEIYVKSRLSLNGRRSQPFTNDTINVYRMPDVMKSGWILPFKP